jgi:hypothetical protein
MSYNLLFLVNVLLFFQQLSQINVSTNNFRTQGMRSIQRTILDEEKRLLKPMSVPAI